MERHISLDLSDVLSLIEVSSSLTGFNLVLDRLRYKGYSAGMIRTIMQKESDDLVEMVIANIDELLETVLKKYPLEDESSDSTHTDWLTEVANRAVDANLNEDGSPKYKSAQGFACAKSALEIALNEQRIVPGASSETEEIPSKEDSSVPSQEAYLLGALKYYDVILEKYGKANAAQRFIEYMLEKMGVVNEPPLAVDKDKVETFISVLRVMFNVAPPVIID